MNNQAIPVSAIRESLMPIWPKEAASKARHAHFEGVDA
jgi:hypothetical protein